MLSFSRPPFGVDVFLSDCGKLFLAIADGTDGAAQTVCVVDGTVYTDGDAFADGTDIADGVRC